MPSAALPTAAGRLVAVALLSAAVLALQVLLVRAFSISQWHHFASMIISVAMLGFGASGTVLTFARERLLARPDLAFTIAAALFAISIPTVFALAGAIPLNVLELAWDPRQPLFLLSMYLLMTIPFFFAAVGIGLALAAAGERAGSVYRSDLVGAGAGALGIVGALFVLTPAEGLKAVAALGLLSAALVVRTLPSATRAGAFAGLALATLAVALVPLPALTPVPSPYKELPAALRAPEARIIAERHGPLGQLSVVESPRVPFRWSPGQSLMVADEPPPQLAVFTDGGGMTAITRFDGDLERLGYLDAQTAAVAFHLRQRPRVLILGAGGGSDVLMARRFGAVAIDAVELDPAMADLVRDTFADFAGDVFTTPPVRLHIAEARSFVEHRRDRWDILQISLLDSFGTAGAGLHALHESPLYTREAFRTLLDRLSPDGVLALTRWVAVPPRDILKAVATAAGALRERGVADPARHVALVRGWRTATLLVSARPWTDLEIATIRAFAAARAFDIDALPGLRREETNRFAALDRPWYHDGAVALLGPDRDAFLADYKFDVRPATDDRPYFFHVLKPATLVELLRLPERSGLNLLDWGYPILLATLAQAVLGSLLLVLLPLAVLRRRADRDGRGSSAPRLRAVAYFTALGLAFLFVEITFIQRLQVFVGHPVPTVAVVLASFLIFAGIGAGRSDALRRRLGSDRRAVFAAATAIAVLIAVGIVGLDPLLRLAGPLPMALRAAVAMAIVAPLAVCMGIPFPLGLARLARDAPPLVPWAWCVNGCASVVSAVLTTVLAVQVGFTAVLLTAACFYLGAALVFPAVGTSGRSGRIRTGDP